MVTPTNEIHSEQQNWSTPHLGIWRLAGFLEKNLHNVDVWDTILDPVLPFKKNWDIIGFSLTHDTLSDDIQLMNKMSKEFSGAIIVAGGIEASSNYQFLFEKVSRLSYVIIGEGELPLLNIANGTNSNGLIAGAISRKFQDISLEDFTAFNFAIPFHKMRHIEHWNIVKSLNPNARSNEINCVRLSTSTFCDRACKFCSTTHIHKMAAGRICKPITMTGDDTKELVRKVITDIPDVKTIYFHDDSFTFSKDKIEAFFDNPPVLEYHVQARTDEVDLNLLRHMARGGCKRISFGVENYSPHILKDLGKGVCVEESDRAIRLCSEVGIEPIILVILFCPTSTMDDIILNWEKLDALHSAGVKISTMTYIRPYHGSWYFNSGMHEIEWRKNKGIKQPYAVLPDDPEVREFWKKFELRLAIREKEIQFRWKVNMTAEILDILGKLLQERVALY